MADGLAPCQEHSGAETEALEAADLSVGGQKLGVLMVIRRALSFSIPGWLTAVLSLLLAAPVQAADRFASVEVAPQAITEGVYMLTGAGGNIGVTTGITIIPWHAPIADITEDLSAFDDWGQGFINTARWISIIEADHARQGEL